MNVVPLHRGAADERSLADACRTFMSGFPTGVVVVTTVDADGVPWGLTCSSLISVTLDPPTLLVSVHSRSRTLHAMRERAAFAVNLLHARGQAAAEVFASSRPDRFDGVRWQPAGPRQLPWLPDDTCGFATCVVAEVWPVGDHCLVSGRLTDIQYHTDAPLLYGLRRFAAWEQDRVRVEDF